jgi:inner membrane protein
LLAIAFLGFVWDYHKICFGFAVGGFSHVLGDSFTISGVPFSPWSEARFHLFGGKLRTGNVEEYIVSGATAFLCAVWVYYAHPNYSLQNANMVANWSEEKPTEQTGQNGFIPFFFNWQQAYSRGEVDGKEWRDNRLKFL